MTDMSMLSAQCDELRQMAESVGLAMPQAATLMMEAADTIWELRGSVHRERSEADRLRERITTQKQTIQAYRDESREWREVADHAQAENAKLRELVKALLTCATDGDCDECRLNGATPWHVGKAQLCDGVWDRVRELGVEADE